MKTEIVEILERNRREELAGMLKLAINKDLTDMVISGEMSESDAIKEIEMRKEKWLRASYIDEILSTSDVPHNSSYQNIPWVELEETIEEIRRFVYRKTGQEIDFSKEGFESFFNFLKERDRIIFKRGIGIAFCGISILLAYCFFL